MSRFRFLAHDLRRTGDQLRGMKLEGRKETSRLMALSECNFRLAVHPETPSSEASQLLEESIRFDGANPKYAYHLGRICFLQQQFEQSSRWFRLACCLAPTSHRIWAHVAVLLHELNGEYFGDERYEPNVLADRAKQILKSIQAGEDCIDPDLLNFVPPPSLAAEEKLARQGRHGKSQSATERDKEVTAELRPSDKVKRYVHSQQCRWSGIDHLSIEQMLAGRPNQANVRELAPLLLQLAEQIPRRAGAAAAFVILCLQWIISGYPVTTVRRLMGHLPPRLPSTLLLENVCSIFEADPSEVAMRLAQSVKDGRIPPSLGALIHRRRLLWKPLEFRNLGLYRTSRSLVAGRHQENGEAPSDEFNEQVHDLVRRLERAVDGLKGSPPRVLKDEVPKTEEVVPLDAETCTRLFDLFDTAARRLKQLLDEGFRLLKDGIDTSTRDIADDAAYRTATVDLAAAEEFVSALSESGQATLQRFDQFVEAVAALDSQLLGNDFSTHREECTSTLQELNNVGRFVKVIKRVTKRLSAAESQFSAGVVEPSAEWTVLIKGVRAAVPDELPDEGTGPNGDAGNGNLDEWRVEAEKFVADIDKDWAQLKDLVTRNKTNELTEEDEPLIVAVRDRFEQRIEVSEGRIEAIGGLRDSGSVSADESDHLDVVEKQYRQVIQSRGRFVKNLRKLPEVETAAITPEPDLNDGDLVTDRDVADTATMSQRDTAPAVTQAKRTANPLRPEPPRPREELSPIELLTYTLNCTDWAVAQQFREAARTFDSYPEWVLNLPAFQLLRQGVEAQWAETAYRLGNRREARQRWNRILRVDRLNVDALKNIAVCDYIEGNVSRSAESWREYAELLYLFDVFGGDPRVRASVRVSFHRSFGNAYAPPFLSAKFDPEWKSNVDPAALISFLSSPGRVKNYIDHRLLEYLNTRFEFNSPSLVVGIKRIETEVLTDVAVETMSAFAREVCQLLPEQTGQQFFGLTQKALHETADACRDRRRMALAESQEYREEEQHQIEILARMYDLKLKLVVTFNEHVDMVKNVTSFEFLQQLTRLNQIPLQLSPGMLPIVAAAISLDEETLLNIDSILTQNIVGSMMKYLFADDDPSEESIRIRQYKLLTKEAAKQPTLKEFLPIIDSGYNFFPDEVMGALNNGPVEAVIEPLRKWHDKYPALGGMAALLASKLIDIKEFVEAQERLELSHPLTIFPPSRRQIQQLLIQLNSRGIQPLMDDENYVAALDLILKMVNLDDWQPTLVQNLMQIFLGASQQSGHKHRADEVTRAADEWLRRAKAVIEAPEDENDHVPRPTEDDLQTARSSVEGIMTKIAELRL